MTEPTQFTGSTGVLLLSHVGFSFVEGLANTIEARGLTVYVLSSLPEPQHQRSRPGELAALADDVRVTGTHELTWTDVAGYLDDLERRGKSVRCCVSVWEGYRGLMAGANARLEVPDLAADQVRSLRDKLTVRNRLADAGLSRSRAAVLTPASLRAHQQATGRFFIKPVTGIASFGAFPLTTDTSWSDIERIGEQARDDVVYSSALTSAPTAASPVRRPRPCSAPPGPAPQTTTAVQPVQFLIEGYVPGVECSFEIVFADGRPHVVAVHEKGELTEDRTTVLENACTSPPVSLSREQVAAGLTWVAAVLDTLGLAHGCLHVEARCADSGWDLIEVNPRVGGSLINASVAALTGGPDLLDLWLATLLDTKDTGVRSLEALEALAYRADGSTPSTRATFFRVFFADPGTITEVRPAEDLPCPPVVSQVLLGPGDTVEPTAREVFLGQLLWCMPLAGREGVLDELVPASAHALKVSYEATSR